MDFELQRSSELGRSRRLDTTSPPAKIDIKMKTAQAPTADELAAAYSTPRWGEIGERDALLAQSFGYC